MSNIKKIEPDPNDLLNPLKNQQDFRDRAERFSRLEAASSRAKTELRKRIRSLELTLESYIGAAQLFKDTSAAGLSDIERLRNDLTRARSRYRSEARKGANLSDKLALLERSATEKFGNVPHYKSIS